MCVVVKQQLFNIKYLVNNRIRKFVQIRIFVAQKYD